MTMHTSRGVRYSVKVDDGFGNLILIDFDSLISRMVTFNKEF